MAGKRRTKMTDNQHRVTIDMPEALWAHLSDQAEAHHRSFNQEVVDVLLARSGTRRERRRAMRDELMALEPGPDDPRSSREIAQQMQAIHDKYEPRHLLTPTTDDAWRDIPEHPTREDILEQIDELPGSLPF
jgi:hypothetical protein